MAVRSLSTLADGVWRVGVFEGSGISDRSGELELSMTGDSPRRPARVTLKYKFNPVSGEAISVADLVPGDRVVVQVAQEALFAPKSGTKFIVEVAMAVEKVDSVRSTPAAA